MNKYIELIGYCGIIILQGSAIPTLYNYSIDTSTVLPPLTIVIALVTGLFLLMLHSIYNKLRLYIVSNTAGFSLYSIVLTLILLGNN